MPEPVLQPLDYAAPRRRRVSVPALLAIPIAIGVLLGEGHIGEMFVRAQWVALAYITSLLGVALTLGFCVWEKRNIRRSADKVYGQSILAVAMAIALLGLLCPFELISLDKSRQLSERSATQARMMKVAEACGRYARDHGGRYPPHLAVLLLEGRVRPEDLLDRMGSTTPLPMLRLTPGTPWAGIAADVEAHCDFAYIGADLAAEQNLESEVVLLYGKAGRTHKHMKSPDGAWDGQGRLAAFADGHSEFFQDHELPGVFARSNAARARLGLPPVTLDYPPPSLSATRPAAPVGH